MHPRECYLPVVCAAENINFLRNASADDYDSDSEILEFCTVIYKKLTFQSSGQSLKF